VRINKITTRKIEDISHSEIEEIINSQPVIFVGSAISMFSPTNLLSGTAFVSKLFDYIFFEKKYKVKTFDWLKFEFDKIPFEAMMECFPHTNELPSIISSMFSTDNYNPYHESLYKKLVQEKFHAIITPNYDMCFDRLLSSGGFEKIIRDHEDFTRHSLTNLDQSYFKIHGTTQKGYTNSLIYTLHQEGTLKQWKKELLYNLIENRVVIMIGYSGRDFDICPVIAEFNNYKKIMWVHCHPDNKQKVELTAYQELLLYKREDNELILGDFETFLKNIFNETILVDRGQISFDPSSYFKLNENRLLEWRLNILDRIACARLGLPLINVLNGKIEDKKLIKKAAEMYGHTGEYVKAAKESLRLSEYYSKNSKEIIECFLSTSGFWLGNGNYYLSYKYLRKASQILKLNYPNDADLKLFILEKKLGLLEKLEKIFLGRTPHFLRRFLVRKIKKIYSQIKNLNESSLLDKRQAIFHNMERLGATENESFILPSFKGYNSLGNTGMALIAYRDKIRKNNWDADEKPFERLEYCISTAESLGMHTELWKFCRIKFTKCSMNRNEKKEVWHKWKENLKVTEYNVLRFLMTKLDLYWHFLKI
jgi:hypothetical protein